MKHKTIQKAIPKAVIAILANTLIGILLAPLLGLSVWSSIFIFNAAGLLLPLIPRFLSFNTGFYQNVYVEAWTKEVVKRYSHAEQNSFMNGIPDFSSKADNSVIHLSDVQGEIEVVVNNTTYPLEPRDLADGDIAISLDKLETTPTSVSDDELYAIAYDKMGVARDMHAEKLAESRLDRAIHAFAPARHTDDTPVILTTGELVEGRRKLIRADLLALRRKLDKLKVPKQGRRLVLCNDHIGDLLEQDQKFAGQYHDYATGVIFKIYGFEIHEYVNNPLYNSTTKVKVSFRAAAGAGDHEASVFFVVNRMFKATGKTTMYHSAAVNDVLYKRNLISFTNRFVALPKKAAKSTAAIVSATV